MEVRDGHRDRRPVFAEQVNARLEDHDLFAESFETVVELAGARDQVRREGVREGEKGKAEGSLHGSLDEPSEGQHQEPGDDDCSDDGHGGARAELVDEGERADGGGSKCRQQDPGEAPVGDDRQDEEIEPEDDSCRDRVHAGKGAGEHEGCRQERDDDQEHRPDAGDQRGPVGGPAEAWNKPGPKHSGCEPRGHVPEHSEPVHRVGGGPTAQRRHRLDGEAEKHDGRDRERPRRRGDDQPGKVIEPALGRVGHTSTCTLHEDG